MIDVIPVGKFQSLLAGDSLRFLLYTWCLYRAQTFTSRVLILGFRDVVHQEHFIPYGTFSLHIKAVPPQYFVWRWCVDSVANWAMDLTYKHIYLINS